MLFEANWTLFDVNQPKNRTKIVPVCIPSCAATCPLYSVDHIFVYVFHNCLTESQLIGALDHDPLIVALHYWSSIILQIVIIIDRRSQSLIPITLIAGNPSDRDHYQSSITIPGRRSSWFSVILQILITTDLQPQFRIAITLDLRSYFQSRRPYEFSTWYPDNRSLYSNNRYWYPDKRTWYSELRSWYRDNRSRECTS